MSPTSRHVTAQEAANLIREIGIFDTVELRDNNADLIFRLNDDTHLAFWSESDFGPAYWVHHAAALTGKEA